MDTENTVIQNGVGIIVRKEILHNMGRAESQFWIKGCSRYAGTYEHGSETTLGVYLGKSVHKAPCIAMSLSVRFRCKILEFACVRRQRKNDRFTDNLSVFQAKVHISC